MSEVQYVEEKVQLPAGMKAVKDLIVDLVKKIHDKAPVAEIIASGVEDLKLAIEAMSEIPSDVKDPQMAVLGGLLGGEIAAIFLAGAPAAAPAAVPAAPSA